MASETLYNAYRPSQLSGVYGQDVVVKQLRSLMQTKDYKHHAYLFFGPYGCGKTTFAKILSRAFNCCVSERGDICSFDKLCALCAAPEYHFNILEYNASIYGRVEEVRDIMRSIRNRPFGAYKYKVYFFDEAHMISKASWTAMLLELEKPPEYVKFIFATTDIDLIPDVVKSRLFIYRINGIDNTSIKEYLAHIADQENYRCEESVLEIVATQARGSMRDAISILSQLIAYCSDRIITKKALDELLGIEPIDRLQEFLNAIKTADIGAVMAILKKYRGRYRAESVINSSIEQLSNELRGSADTATRIVINDMYAILEFIERFSSYGDSFNLFDVSLINRMIERKISHQAHRKEEVKFTISHVQEDVEIYRERKSAPAQNGVANTDQRTGYANTGIGYANNKNPIKQENLLEYLIDLADLSIRSYQEMEDDGGYLSKDTDELIYHRYNKMLGIAIKRYGASIEVKKSKGFDRSKGFFSVQEVRRVLNKYKYMRLNGMHRIEIYKDAVDNVKYSDVLLETISNDITTLFIDKDTIKLLAKQADYSERIDNIVNYIELMRLEVVYQALPLTSESIEIAKKDKTLYDLELPRI